MPKKGKTLNTRAWCLIGRDGSYASLTPIVRFNLGDGADQLRKGWDSANPENAPHEWAELQTPHQQEIFA